MLVVVAVAVVVVVIFVIGVVVVVVVVVGATKGTPFAMCSTCGYTGEREREGGRTISKQMQ